jgi:hypothetical protein
MRSRWLAYALVATAVACSEGSDEGPGTVTDPAVLPGGTTGGGGLAGASPDAGNQIPGVAGGTTGGVGAPGGVTGGITPGGTTGGGNAAGGGGAIPCDVQKILKDKCQTCHSNPVVGAPMPLVTLADFQAASGSKPAEKNWQRSKARINETGATSMPPPGRPALTAAEKSTLDAFLAGGAKGVAATTCAPAGTGGVGATGGGATGGTAIGGDWQPPDSDCDVLMDLKAHGGQTANDTTPYSPTGNGDQYEIFWFAPTWNEKMHVIRIDPIIDNGAILHHWLLYMKDRGSEPVGSHNPDSGLQSAESALLSGWAPGNKNIPLGTEVGLQVVQGPQARFGIEIHYNTSARPANRQDRSGARLCLTKKLRPKEAATHWLGTQAIVGFGGKFDAVGTCSVKMESHIIAHSPHMHKTGRYMKSIISKQGGGMQTITDKPFAFEDQQIFPVDAPGGEIVVKPGDKITTTCSYDAPGIITFGPGTNSEMCYNFVIAYPVGSLSNGSPGLVGGKNTCIDGL